MALNLGRRRQEEDSSYDTLNQRLIRELTSAGERTFTGVLEVEERGGGGTARLFMFDGGLYAAQLEGYEPPVLARLRSSGAVVGDQWDELAALAGDDQRDPRLGVFAVQRGWVTADALAIVHQEYVMASLGAILSRPKTRAALIKNEQTADFCTLPVPIEPLFGAVQRRARRMAGTWSTLGVSGTPETTTPIRTGADVPARLSMPEFTAMTEAVDGQRNLDAVAEAVGFTRAEAVHMAGLLVLAGVIRVETATSPIPGDRLLVPEEYGRAIAAAPRRSRVGEVGSHVTSTPAPSAPEPQAPEPQVLEPQAEPVPQPAAEPAPHPQVPEPPAGDAAAMSEQVRQLRIEIATAEKAELEAVLREATLAEQEAIARSAAVRARLRDAQATIDMLSEPGFVPDAP